VSVWFSGIGLDQRSHSTVCGCMADCLQAGKTNRYVNSHPGQLSLAIPQWKGALNITKSWAVNRHTMQWPAPYPWSCSV